MNAFSAEALRITPRDPTARVRRSSEVRADGRRSVERSFERGFRTGLTDLRGVLTGLPPLVRCAVRVHDRREPAGALVLGLDVVGARGKAERWSVVVARMQRLALVFGAEGVLETAGWLVPNPAAPVEPGQRWTHIEWAEDVECHDWY